MTTETLTHNVMHAQQGPLGKNVAVDLWNLGSDNQIFRKESYELRIFMIATATVCFFLAIIYILFCIA